MARNYGELRGTQRRLEIAANNIRVQADSLELARVRAEAGLGTDLDVERQLSQLAATQAMVPSLEAVEAGEHSQTLVLLGEEPGALEGRLDGGESACRRRLRWYRWG